MSNTNVQNAGCADVEFAAPSGRANAYDRSNLMIYAALLDADENGVNWEQSAGLILGLDVEADRERAFGCWRSHIERARWIVSEGLASAVETFGRRSNTSKSRGS